MGCPYFSSPNAGLGRFRKGPGGMKTMWFHHSFFSQGLCVHSISYSRVVCRSLPKENWWKGRNGKELEERCRQGKKNLENTHSITFKENVKSVLTQVKIMKHPLSKGVVCGSCLESSYPNQKHMRCIFRTWPHQTSLQVTSLLFTYTCTLHMCSNTESAYTRACTLSTKYMHHKQNSLFTCFLVTHMHKKIILHNHWQWDPVGCCWECVQPWPIHCYRCAIFQSQCQPNSELEVAMIIELVTHVLTTTHMSRESQSWICQVMRTKIASALYRTYKSSSLGL